MRVFTIALDPTAWALPIAIDYDAIFETYSFRFLCLAFEYDVAEHKRRIKRKVI